MDNPILVPRLMAVLDHLLIACRQILTINESHDSFDHNATLLRNESAGGGKCQEPATCVPSRFPIRPENGS